MIIDDHSRFLVGGGLFYNDNAYNFQKVLKEAVAAHGIPAKLYVDNGCSYSNEQLSLIGYNVDWSAMCANRFGIISYRKNSLEFARDLYKVICDLFFKYHMNRISWCAYADNPAIRGYRNFIKKHGGRECGYYRQAVRLQDGLLHDSVEFEILAEEFRAGGILPEQM